MAAFSIDDVRETFTTDVTNFLGKIEDSARQLLETPGLTPPATRLADGMTRAWEATKKTPITAQEVDWRTLPVSLPVAPYLDEAKLRADLKLGTATSISAADKP